MDSLEDYVRKWTQRMIKINKLESSKSTKATSVFKDPGVAKTQFIIQGKRVVVPVDNTPNHIVLVSKKHVL